MNILFLCQHGGAKSVMAAAWVNQLGTHTATAASTEEPYDAVPAPVVELMQRDGIDVRDFTPRRVEPHDLASATRVIAIDCDVPGAERWDDVPKVSDDLEGAAAAIRRHIEELHGRT